MPRAPKAPGHLDRPAWRNTTRQQRLPSDWQAQRAAVLEAAGYRCQQLVEGQPCGADANQVDHVRRGEGDLQALCRAHHAAKSAREGAEARYGRRY